jgi:L-alanine-DL-glutamate epimerase-like enolase superfamily enzyme
MLAGAVGSFAATPKAAAPRQQTPAPVARAASRLPAATITKIRVFYPPNYDANGPQAFPQSNMVVLVDTDAGITGGRAGRVAGYGPQRRAKRHRQERVRHRDDLAGRVHGRVLLSGQGAAARARRYRFGALGHQGQGTERAALSSCSAARRASTSSCTRRWACRRASCPPAEAAAMGLKERASATMAAGYRVYRVDGGILPSTGRGTEGGTARAPELTLRGGVFDSRARIPQIIKALEQIREGVGPDGNWMIDVHQKFDFHEAVELCRTHGAAAAVLCGRSAARGAVPHADSESCAC